MLKHWLERRIFAVLSRCVSDQYGGWLTPASRLFGLTFSSPLQGDVVRTTYFFITEMDPFSRHAIRVSVAQICQIIGYTSIQSSPLEILTDLLSEYITGLAKIAARYAMLFGQTEPNLHHIALAFKDMGISVSELEEYVTYVESNTVLEVPKYPIPKESHLNHLKPGSREVVTRPFHVHEHLPPMHPHLEDQDYLINKSPLTIEVPTSDSLSPLSSPKDVFKKPGDPISSDLRRRQLLEDEIRPLREISSVMMTTSGFLSPAREGKLPEARTQPLEFSNPPSPETPSPTPPEQPTPTQPPPQPPAPSIEIKPEKKKKTKSADPGSKKPDKENKTKEEASSDQKDTEDEQKGKKLVTTKETSKLKAFKTGAFKMQHKPQSPTPSPPLKKAKLSPCSNIAMGSKQCKIKSPKIDKTSLSPLPKDTSTLISLRDPGVDPDIKLTSEPDKQKLNIFKKITKVKEDHDESKPLVHANRDLENTLVNNVSQPLVKTQGDLDIPDSKLDNVASEAPVINETVNILPMDEIPKIPSVESLSELPKPPPEIKKKKKDKQKEKKEIQVDKDTTKNKCIEDSEVKQKSLAASEPTSFEGDDRSSPIQPVPIVPSGLIPPIWNSTLIPLPIPPISINPPSSNLSQTKKQETPSSDRPITSITSESPPPISSHQALSAATVSSINTKESEVISAKKKEKKKDKKLKEKIKKKKDKKDKSKTKEKSEKKKLKLEKKEKTKSKSKKDKKEKKKEKDTVINRGFEQSHIAEDILNTLTPWATESFPAKKPKIEEKEESSSVPKITFKLGPSSPNDVQDSLCPRKIKSVIKPIVKKEEETSAPCSSASPEFIKPLLMTPKLKTPKCGKPVLPGKVDTIEKPSFLFPQLPKADPSVPKWEEDPNQLWICPACGRPDDGSPMIACDYCDLWFHWTCVGIVEAIESDWYCKKCTSTKEDGQVEKKKKHRKKKNTS